VTLSGIDVSKYNTLSATSLKGLSFAFARATYGTTRDWKFQDHMTAFRKAGIVAGAYHFGVGWTTVAAQVAAFLTASKGADLLVLDLERDNTKTMTNEQAREFIKAVQATGKKVGLYHSRSGFPQLGQDYNWVAQWGQAAPNITWAFWQWQGSPLDRNKFNGDLDALRSLAGKSPAPLPPVTQKTLTNLRRYISNLAAVKRPAVKIATQLAMYRLRLKEYLKRGK
jgi:GH25 family lysozyme M1 (1,4-beta-N-acetylmuramidase)